MKPNKKRRITPLRLTGILLLGSIIVGLVGYLLLADKNIAVLNPQGIIAQKQLDLIIFTTLLGVLVVVPVFVLLFSFAWKYRDTNPRSQRYTPDADGSTLLEAIWWGIPIVIIIILSIVTWVSTHDLDPYKSIQSDKKAVTIRVVAMQWKWLFLYPEENIVSVNEVKFPVDTPITFEVTADAPMSAFWIPNLGSQTYAMNGMSSTLNLMASRTGEYRGSNTNISGEGYAGMQFKAIAVPDDEYTTWINSTKQANKGDFCWSAYEEFAKPTEDESTRQYRLGDKYLYDRIIHKYMGSMSEHKMDWELDTAYQPSGSCDSLKSLEGKT